MPADTAMTSQGDARISSVKRPGRPLVSIVTVVFNGARTLEGTIISVLEQSYENIEYIIIDGGSTDGTQDIIRKYNDDFDHVVSEPDNGIYDAMNKGIALASGEWINFMNAGDTFYHTDTVELVFEQHDPTADIIFGSQQVIYPDGHRVIKRSKPLHEIRKDNICWHQSMFARTRLLKERPFNTAYKISADFDFALYSFMQNRKFHDSGRVVASIMLGGYSDNNLLQANREKRVIAQSYAENDTSGLYFIIQAALITGKLFIKRILPRKLTNAIISILNR